MTNNDHILSVQDLTTEFSLQRGLLRAVNHISFDLERGEVLGLVGESGCGKSIAVKSILRLVRKPGHSTGKVYFKPREQEPLELIGMKPMGDRIRTIRGKHINMIFQEPMNALSPVHTIANQMIEAIMLHNDVSKEQAREQSIELLRRVGIPQAEKRIDSYSFQLSGGIRKREDGITIWLVKELPPDIANDPSSAEENQKNCNPS